MSETPIFPVGLYWKAEVPSIRRRDTGNGARGSSQPETFVISIAGRGTPGLTPLEHGDVKMDSPIAEGKVHSFRMISPTTTKTVSAPCRLLPLRTAKPSFPWERSINSICD